MKATLDAIHANHKQCNKIAAKLYILSSAAYTFGLRNLGIELEDIGDTITKLSSDLCKTIGKDLHDNLQNDQKEIGENLSAMLKAATYPDRDNG